MNKLEAKVFAANKCRSIANDLYDPLAAVFLPLVGQKILKKEGGLLKKFSDQVEALNLPNTNQIRIYRNSSDYSLAWSVNYCTFSEGYSVNDSVSVYIGKLKGEILSEMENKPTFRTDFTVEAVLEARKELEAAKKALNQAQGKLYPFGEYDN